MALKKVFPHEMAQWLFQAMPSSLGTMQKETDAVKELRRPRAPVLRNRPCDILKVPPVLHLSGSNV